MYQEMSVHELAAGLERRDVVLLDVRDAEHFAVGHIPGSVPVSLPELPGRLRDPDDELWARLFGARRPVFNRVCIVGDAERSIDAVAILGEVGIESSVVAGGTRAWSAAGRPLNRHW
ncbi:rhodanese-like domain-containing protein [Actinomycetospora straminea]|uniref:Rhodanese domain-containing protein n=1 Tax=Actinomycetospora straminea TaxID=663607 RepID=A0ABP9EIL1_9PSEU|nr:rhodanese-like domain-containing protein [Actinomycetospora straminea]MDD7933111.1 rhodanese-like domain-containing protein [Actinomycetospora straminea]